ncbi:hypothetical protein [Desulfitobacterium dehalogenans]|nr:hypothetical protein [Desulfitobacterium dehalogenans]
MKRKRRIMLMLLILIFVLIFGVTGCVQEAGTSLDIPEAEKLNLAEEYTTQVVFIKKTNNTWLAVDERGNIHQVNVAEVDPSVQSGCTTRGKVTINPSGDFLLDIDSGYGMSYIQQIKASYEEAPKAYAELLLDNFLYSSNPDYAVSEYDLKTVQVKKAYRSGRIDAVIIFDVKPREGAYWWGESDHEGYARNRQVGFTLYGAEETWLSVEQIAQYFSPDYKPIEMPKTQYAPSEKQNVIYEDELWSYYGDKDFLPPRNNEPAYATIKEYLGSIHRVNRQSGETERLYQGDRNYTYNLLGKYDNKLYILSDTWEPASEGRPGYFGVLDLETKKYRKLIEGGVIRAAIDGEKGYLFANDKLMRIDLGTAAIERTYSLGFYPNYSYDVIRVNRIRDGKMYFGFWGFTMKHYVIDLESGDIEEL